MSIEEKAKAYDEAVAYAKRVLDGLAEDYRCTHMTKDDIKNQYSRLFPHEEAFCDDEDSFVRRKLIYGLKSLIQQGKETFAGADIGDLIYYLEKKKEQEPAEWHPTHEQMVALNWAANGIDNNSPCAGDIKASLRSLYNDLQSKSIRAAERRDKQRPKFPANLDEAAEKYAGYDQDCEGAFYEPMIIQAFKHGAEWAFGQGIVTEQTVDRTPLNGPDGIMVHLYDFDGFKHGDKVIVQIRKKQQ